MARYCSHALIVWFFVSGGLSGILIAAIALELVTPGGHPIYQDVRRIILSVLGLQ